MIQHVVRFIQQEGRQLGGGPFEGGWSPRTEHRSGQPNVGRRPHKVAVPVDRAGEIPGPLPVRLRVHQHMANLLGTELLELGWEAHPGARMRATKAWMRTVVVTGGGSASA